jgi:hypothetical protein
MLQIYKIIPPPEPEGEEIDTTASKGRENGIIHIRELSEHDDKWLLSIMFNILWATWTP